MRQVVQLGSLFSRIMSLQLTLVPPDAQSTNGINSRTTQHSPLTTHHSPLTTHHSPLTTHHPLFISLLLLMTLGFFLFFYRLGDRDLWSSHEGRAAQDAETILEDGNW